MTADDLLQHLEKIQRDINDRDPLLKIGVGPDQYAAINPAMVGPLEDQARSWQEDHLLPSWCPPGGLLKTAVGRPVLVIEECPFGEVQFGTYIALCKKYPEWAAREFAKVMETADDED